MSTAVMSASTELRGIGSVLGSSEYQRSKTAASLRRTFSAADMSSKKCLSSNGFCPLEKIASSSSEEFQTEISWNSSIPHEEKTKKEGEPSSIPHEEKTKKKGEPPGQVDIWSSIVAQKEVSAKQTPYVHPLAKRSRSLSQKSLEICTESLGSETGSDGFSSIPPSEISEDEQEVEQQEVEEEKEAPVLSKQESGVVNCNSYAVKKSPPRSFPPPLPSLTQASLHMRSHRVAGRLVVEAVTVPAPSQNLFQAQREGGRLLLTLANPKSEDTTNIVADTKDKKEDVSEEEKMYEAMFQEEENEDDEFDEEEEEEDDSEEEENEQVMDRGIVLEMKVSQPTKRVPTGVINVHRSALMVNKLMGLTNIDPTWSPKLAQLGDEHTLAQSLPPQPLVTRLMPSSAAAAASSFNTYDYCWRTKSVATPTVCPHPLTQNPTPLNNKNNKFLLPKNLNPQNQQELVLMRGNKADYLVPFFKGCKDTRRSLLVWEPYCIATS